MRVSSEVTYFPDLCTGSMLGAGESLRAVGWLSPEHAYTRGDVSPKHIRLLKEHLSDAFQTSFFMGCHTCEFCLRRRKQMNLIVPTSEVVYVAPEMILHYVTEHGYRPPDCFFEALQACPKQGSPDYMRLFIKFHTYFRLTEPSPEPTCEQREQIALLVERGLREIRLMCIQDDVVGARNMASALEELTNALHGWGLWYRHLFPRIVNHSRDECPVLIEYLNDYNDILGGHTEKDHKIESCCS